MAESYSVTKRYADYVEVAHKEVIDSVVSRGDAVIEDSPFASYMPLNADDSFIGLSYVISSFPALYDVFGKFMAGLDIEDLWKSAFEKMVDRPEINARLAEEIKIADENMVKGELADFQVQMRNANAVSTSSFIVGKSVLENKRIKNIAKMSLDMKMAVISQVNLPVRLNWMADEVRKYAIIMKEYFAAKITQEESNYIFASRDAIWPFKILNIEGVTLGTMTGAASWVKTYETPERSDLSKGLLIASYTVSGAYIGSSWGPYGTAIGAVVGFIVGVAMVLLE